MSKKIGVGIVGLSATRGWASQTHLPALQRLKDVFDLRGLSASSPDSAKAAAEKYGVPFHTASAAELAARPDVDLVVVSVKVTEHREPVLAAIAARKHVFCEWPLGVSLAQAEEMEAAQRAAGVRGFVGLQARYAPGVRYARDLLAQGYIGKVLSVSVTAAAPAFIRPGAPTPRAVAVYLDRRNGAGMLNIPFGHSIDGLSSLFGELRDIRPTLAVQQNSTTLADTGETIPVTIADQLALTGVFENGAVAAIHYRAGAAQSATGFRCEINGDKGTLILNGPFGHLQLAPVTLQGAQGRDAVAELAIPESYAFHDIAIADAATSVGGLYAAIGEDLRDGGSRAVSFADAVKRHRMIDAIERAAGVS